MIKTRPPQLWQWLFLSLWFLLILSTYFLQIQPETKNSLYSDYGKFYESAQLAIQHKNPYAQIYVALSENHALPAIKKFPGNLSTPFTQTLMLPLGYLSYATGLWIITALSVICIFVSSYLVFWIFYQNENKIKFWQVVFLSCALLTYMPTFLNIICGQITLFLLPLTLLTWHYSRKTQWTWAGILLSLLVSLKIYFGLFLLYFLYQKAWRGIFSFTLLFLFLSLIPFLFFDKDIYSNYYQMLHHIWWYSTNWNASLYGQLIRYFGGDEKSISLFNLAYLTKPLYWSISFTLIISLIAYSDFTKNISSPTKIDLIFSIFLVAMLLISPLGWNYYFPLLLIPGSIIYTFIRAGLYPFRLAILLACTIIVSSSPQTLERFPMSIHDILFSSSYYFYSLIMLMSLLWYTCFLYKKPVSYRIMIQPSILYTLCFIALLPSFLAIMTSTATLSKLSNTSYPQLKIIRIEE